MTGILLPRHRPRDAETDTQGEHHMTYDNIGRDWSNCAVTNQETSNIANNHQKLGKTHETASPSESPEGTNLANILI